MFNEVEIKFWKGKLNKMNFLDNLIITAQCRATVYGGRVGNSTLANVLLVNAKGDTESKESSTITDQAIQDALDALNGKDNAAFKATDVFSEVTNQGGGIALEIKGMLIKVGIIVLISVAVWNLIKYGSSKTGQKVDESKEGLGRAVIAIVGIAALAGIVSLLLGVGSGLFATTTTTTK